MAISKPYYRTYRSFTEAPESKHSSNSHNSSRKYITDNSSWQYITGSGYAKDPELYLRSFKLILKDLETLFEYIEPSDEALKTFSFRIHELLVRSCIEIESNFKAILRENTFSKAKLWNISDYRKIDVSHHLSSFKVQLPHWRDGPKIFAPFEPWLAYRSKSNDEGKTGLSWYQAYNAGKHDRHSEFPSSNFDNLLNAIAALAIVISAQFKQGILKDGPAILVTGKSIETGFDDAEWGPFRLSFPQDWDEHEQYDFDWSDLKDRENSYTKFDYDSVWP